MVDKKAKVAVPNMYQPLEGLLYDLDLLPEQCRSEINHCRRMVIELLCKTVEMLRRKVEK